MSVHVLYTPVPSHSTAQGFDILFQAADKLSVFLCLFFIFLYGFPFHCYAFQPFLVFSLFQPSDVFCLIVFPCFNLTVSLLFRFPISTCFFYFFAQPIICKIFFSFFVQRPLIPFPCQHIICPFSTYFFCDYGLCSHCVYR